MNNFNLENDFLTTESLVDTAKKGSFETKLSDDNYDAQIVGVVTKMAKSKDTGKEYRAYNLVFQVKDDVGNAIHVASKALTPTLSQKSTLYGYLKGWLKQTDANAITEALTKANIINEKGFNFIGFIGKQCKISVTMTPRKSDATKLDPIIMGILPAKKDSAYTAVKADLNTGMMFMKDRDGEKFMDVVNLKEPKARAVITDNVNTQPVDTEAVNSDELPF